MKFTEFIREDIKKLLGYPELPIYFFWDAFQDNFKIPSEPYIIYQVEQLTLGHKRGNHNYNELLSNATKIYDYSKLNFDYLPADAEFKPFLPDLDSKYIDKPKEIDVLFYGYMSSKRSQKIKSLESEYLVVCKDELELDEMKDLIAKSKYVLSVGTYTNDYNDSLRITPALNMGANILMEKTSETWYTDYLVTHFPDRVVFI